MNSKVCSLFSALSSVFFPRCCPGCQAIMENYENTICWKCQLQLPWTHYHSLPKNPMWEQLQRHLDISLATALLFFHPNSRVQQFIYALKHKGQETLGAYLGLLLGHLLEQTAFAHCTGIVPLPLHPKRVKQRGYNQITQFAYGLSKVLKIPVYSDAVQRIKHTPSLALGSYKNRWDVMKGAFCPTANKSYDNMHWLLVDDVLTTGATLTSCAKVLLSFPNSKVSIATLAYRMS